MPPKGSLKKAKSKDPNPESGGTTTSPEARVTRRQAPRSSKRKVEEDEDGAETKVDGDSASPVKRQRVHGQVVKQEKQLDVAEAAENTPPTKERSSRGQRSRKAAVKEEEKVEATAGESSEPEEAVPSKPVKKARKKTEVVKEDPGEPSADGEPAKKPAKKKRKTKEEKEAENMPLAARTIGHKLFIGAHVSSAGGVQNAVTNSLHIGANAFALFLKSQRKWANPPLAEEARTSFHSNCATHSYDAANHIVPHGSYLVNLAHTDPARTTQAYTAFLDDLQRCERLGIKLYNFHPGNTVSNDRQAAIAHLAHNLNAAHKATSTVVTLLENMAAGGNVLGSSFEDLRDIISQVEDISRVGVCLDTCHAFAAGYDLRTPETFDATLRHFDEVVGMKYLRALHLNDSKAPFASHRDLHANIGTGFLGLRAFWNVVNEARFEGLPLVLETPIEVRDEDGKPVKDEKGKVKEDKGIWAGEIKMLEGLIGVEVKGDEFRGLEERLARKGAPERERLEEQIGRKREKEAKAMEKGKDKGRGKGKKKGGKGDESEGVESSGLSEPDEDEG